MLKPLLLNQDETPVSQYNCSCNDQHKNFLDVYVGEAEGAASAVHTCM